MISLFLLFRKTFVEFYLEMKYPDVSKINIKGESKMQEEPPQK